MASKPKIAKKPVAKAKAKPAAKAAKKPVAKAKVIAKKSPVKKAAAKPVAKKSVAKKVVKPAPKKAPVKKAAPKAKAIVKKAAPKAAPKKAVVAKKPAPKAAVPNKKATVVAKGKTVTKVAPKTAVKAAPKAPAKAAPKAPTKAAPIAKTAAKVAPKAAAKPIVAPKAASPKPAEKAVVKADSGPKDRASIKAEKAEAKKQAAIFKQVSATFNPLYVANTISRPISRPEVVKPKPEVPDNRKPLAKGEVEKTRYTDSELEEFRQIIQKKMAIAREEYEYYMEQLKDQGEDTDHKYNPEEGGATTDKEQLNLMASRMLKYIGNLEAALIRIENKTYGICKDTGRLIPKQRLFAVPHATQIIEAKQQAG